MENLTGRFTREHRISNFMKSTGWNISRDNVLYKWYDGHRLDFHTDKAHNEISIDLDKVRYTKYTNKTMEEAKVAIINHLIDEGVYAIRLESNTKA